MKAVAAETLFYAITLVIIIFIAFQKWVMFSLCLEIIGVVNHRYH